MDKYRRYIDGYGRECNEADHFFRLCRLAHFKGGGSTTVQNTTTYQASPEERELQALQANYAQAISPNSLWLNDTARKILENSIGAVQVDFNKMNSTAQNQISNAQNGFSQLSQGLLPSAYVQNMSDAVRSSVQDAYGNLLNKSAQNGVINSSVATKGMNDISKNVSDAMAKSYLNNVQTLQGLYGAQIDAATAPITTGAAAQEAAQQPAINLWNASLGLNGATTGALAAAAGKGTTSNTQTQKQSGGGGLLSGLLGGLF